MALQYQDILKLSLPKKVAILAGIQLVLCGAYYYTFFQPSWMALDGKSAELEKLMIQKKEQQAIADNLPKFKAEAEKLEADLRRVLNQLPNKAEIPNLLRSVSDVGVASGLEFVRFKPGKEAPREFYAAVPVELEIIGGYHQIATFFDRVAKLPRIVTISDIDIKEKSNEGGKLLLNAKCTATTYKFLDDAERAAVAAADAKTKKAKKGKSGKDDPKEA